MSGIGRIPLCLLSSINHLLLLITLVSAAPNYLSTYCPNSNTTLSSGYRSSINTLLSNLSASADRSSAPGFHYTSSAVYGLYLCCGDLDPTTCRDCVAASSTILPHKCPSGTQAVIWYDECMVRYSNTSFFGRLDDNFAQELMNTQNVTINVTGFNQVLSTTLSKVATEAAGGGATKKFATEQAKFNDFKTLYTLGQCTPDLSSSDCYQCLQQGFNILSSGYRQGWRVMFFSCTLHYEIYKFYQAAALAPVPAPTPNIPTTPLLVAVAVPVMGRRNPHPK